MPNKEYLFETDNLGFRPVRKDDLDYLIMLDTDPEVRHFFPTTQSSGEIKEKITRYINEYSKKGYGMFVVFDVISGEFIGRAGFGDIENNQIETGYVLLKKHWGKGYATRILKALLYWAKNNIHTDQIIAFTPINHIASQKVMQKAGMTFSRKEKMKGEDCIIYEYKL